MTLGALLVRHRHRGLALVGMLGSAACAIDPASISSADPVGATDEALVQNKNGDAIAGEPAVPNAGAYRAVLRSGGCTATIIAPYLAVSAYHCGKPGTMWYDDGTSFNVERSWANPYLLAPYLPPWWNALNEAQKSAPGGRQDDWPAMHDTMIHYLPGVTPRWLADNGVQPVQVFADWQRTQYNSDPSMDFSSTKSFVSVGLSGNQRHYGPIRFLAPNVGSITSSPRDGYIERDGVTAGFVQVRPGDSGSPSFWQGPNGTEMAAFPAIIGTTQNGCPGRGPGGRNDPSNMNVEGCTFGGDIAPIGSFSGMSANQSATAILNGQWVKSHLVDTDGDGVTDACDTAPNDSAVWTSLCASPLQVAPSEVPAQEVPRAAILPDLFDRIGAGAFYDATRSKVKLCGVNMRSGWLVDNIQLIYCQESAVGTQYFTSPQFGGNGGGSKIEYCQNGWWISHFNVWTNYDAATAHRLTALQPVCTNGSATVDLSIYGRERGTLGMGPNERQEKLSCDGTGYRLTGLLARRENAPWLSSVYPICEPKPSTGGSRGGK